MELAENESEGRGAVGGNIAILRSCAHQSIFAAQI